MALGSVPFGHPAGHLELDGQLVGGHAAARLQESHQLDKAPGSHAATLPGKVAT
jgi:hypothetical protein